MSQRWSGSVPLSPDPPLQRRDHTNCREGTDAPETSHGPGWQKPSGFSSHPEEGWALERRGGGGFPPCFSGSPDLLGRLPSPDPCLRRGLQARGLVLSRAQAHVHGGAAGGGAGGHPGVPPAIGSTIRAAAIGTVVGAVGVRAGGDAVWGWVRLGAPKTGFAVPDQYGHCHPPRGQRVGSQLQGFILPLPLAFVPPVLEPDFHLRGGELEHAGEVLPFRSGEVFLLLKSLLQFKHLSLGE